MCGIAAVLLADSSGDVNTMLFDALTVLQHRGQDAAGMVTCELSPPHRLHLRKDNGLVKDVFTQQHMLELVGPMGLAHARYRVSGAPRVVPSSRDNGFKTASASDSASR